MDKIRAIITYAKEWEMEGRTGITIEYLMTDNFNNKANDDGSKGCRFCKESISVSNHQNIKMIPGLYDMFFDLKTQNGKPTLKLSTINFVSGIYEQPKEKAV